MEGWMDGGMEGWRDGGMEGCMDAFGTDLGLLVNSHSLCIAFLILF